MNSWKQDINSNLIYLNIRNEYQNLHSKILEKIIQKEFNTLGISIKFQIEKNNNYLKKTPMELIYSLYKEKISKLKQEFLINPDIILIQSFFDTNFNEKDINVFNC